MEYFAESSSAITAYDAESIKTVVKQIAEHPEVIQKTAKHGAEAAVKLHNPETIRERFWSVLQEVLQK